MITRLALAGRFKAGKDYVAILAGFKILSFAEPMYRLFEYRFGPCDKRLPDVRRWLQMIGQVGWGHHDPNDPDYNFSFSRFLMIDWVRKHGYEATGMEANWSQFGQSQTFWVDILIRRLKTFAENTQVAVTNLRFEHEWQALRDHGFKRYLVMCDEATREARNGGPIPQATDNDRSEEYAKELADRLPAKQIIWNATPPKSYADMLTIAEFVKEVHKGCS